MTYRKDGEKGLFDSLTGGRGEAAAKLKAQLSQTKVSGVEGEGWGEGAA